jgi:hypothetical protein
MADPQNKKCFTCHPPADDEIKLVFYPGENPLTGESGVRYPDPKDPRDRGYAIGTIYVIPTYDKYQACGGPPVLRPIPDDEGHMIERTPKGVYVLGPPERYATSSWTDSAIPFGAKLRDCNHVVAYQNEEGGPWRAASGPKGALTVAWRRYLSQKYGRSLTADEESDLSADTYRYFLNHGKLMSEFKGNGFGEWAFNLTQGGKRTGYFLHTTPEDEAQTERGKAYVLNNSHGCIHIRPFDRRHLMALSYLRQGVQLEVKGYEERGPPPGWATKVLSDSPRCNFEYQPVLPLEHSYPGHPPSAEDIWRGDAGTFFRYDTAYRPP